MARKYKNETWDVLNLDANHATRVCVAVLMDLRDELQAIRKMLEWHKLEQLEQIARNTAKPKKRITRIIHLDHLGDVTSKPKKRRKAKKRGE